MLLKIPVFRASRESNNANIVPFLRIFPVNCLLSGNSRVRLVRHGLRRAPLSPAGHEFLPAKQRYTAKRRSSARFAAACLSP
jgi:hypothetical protein